jgi:hypothetical protein
MLSLRAARRGSLGFVSAAAEPFGGANKYLHSNRKMSKEVGIGRRKTTMSNYLQK